MRKFNDALDSEDDIKLLGKKVSMFSLQDEYQYEMKTKKQKQLSDICSQDSHIADFDMTEDIATKKDAYIEYQKTALNMNPD